MTRRDGRHERDRRRAVPSTWGSTHVSSAFARGGAVALVMLLPFAAFAHEEPASEEEEISEEIALHPNDATLYVQRAESHRSQREWTAGVADLQTANRLDPELDVVDLALAQMLLAADNPQAALPAADRFLARHGDHAGAHLTRAHILVKLGSRREAVDEFTRGIDLAQRGGQGSRGAQPDDYLERARVLACEGGARVDEAIRGLDEGTVALSGAITLQFLAIDLEVEQKRWDAALKRLAAVEAGANRKETWIARRADVLVQAGRTDEARQAYATALTTIDALPERLRATAATTELASRIRGSLSSLNTPAAASQPFPRSELAGHVECGPQNSPL